MSNSFPLDPILKSLEILISENPDKLGIKEAISDVQIERLGKGESNISLLVTVNKKQKLVFRLAQLYADSLEKEFETLSKIPTGIGPKPIYLNTEKNVIDYPFLVESFVPGQTVHKWDKTHLSEMAQTLATLHSKTKIKKEQEINFGNKLKEDNNYFFKNCPELLNDKEVEMTIKFVLDILESKNFLLKRVNTVSVLHGDLNSENILLGDDGKIRFIDWELSHYNDIAREFSTFYYDDMKYLNWRIQLESPLKDFFLDEYSKRADIKDEEFKERVFVWQLVDKTGAFIYCKWKSLTIESEKEKDKFSEVAYQLKISIEAYF